MIEAARLLALADGGQFRDLFVDYLGWSNPDQPTLSVDIEGLTYVLEQVAGYKGLRVWHCEVLPQRKIQRLIDQAVGAQNHERLIIFSDERTQAWRWPRRAQMGGANAKLVLHHHYVGQPDPRLIDQLASIAIEFEEDLTLVELLSRMRAAFDVEAELASVQAARLMGALYTELEEAGWADHEATMLLARLLFLYFGDDSAMWDAQLFQGFVSEHTTSENLAGRLKQLFLVLNTDEDDRPADIAEELKPFRYVNGGLFRDEIEFGHLTPAFRDALMSAGGFDWSAISPAVFGSMFQTVKDKDARRHGGEHYTTEKNILRTINPLFLDDLHARLARAWDDRGQLTKLHNELGRLRVIDPACGCGNFLIVSYRELRAIELDLLLRYRELEVLEKGRTSVQQSFDVTGDIKVTLDHFYGIEIEEWPAHIAETAMLLVDHLANQRMEQDFGHAPDRLPIRIAPLIVNDNAVQVDWRSILEPSDDVIVVGNPPFVAMHKMTTEQQEDRAAAFGEIPESRGQRTGRLDYVASWYAKAIAYARGTKARIAFVSTNSLMQGDSARALDPIFRATGNEILFAHRSFQWDTESTDGAVVYCVIVGFTQAPVAIRRRLFDYTRFRGEPTEQTARKINCYLIDTELPGPAKRTMPLVDGLPRMSKGSQPTDGGFLLVTEEQYDEVAVDPVAASYLAPWAQSSAILDDEKKWCLWLVGSTEADRSNSPTLRERLASVSKMRLKSPTPSVKSAAKTPWLFTQLRQPQRRWLAIPRHSSEYRISVPMKELGKDIIAGDALAYIEECPSWLFVYLQSSAFTDWIRTFSGALKGSFRISPDMTYNVFPFIEPTGELRDRFDRAAKALVAARDNHSDRTLASLYDSSSMPADLAKAHAGIDVLVDGVYGLTKPTESERSLALLARHHEIVAAETLLPAPRARRRIARN